MHERAVFTFILSFLTATRRCTIDRWIQAYTQEP